MAGMWYWFSMRAAMSRVVWFTWEPPAPKVTLIKSGRISFKPSKVL